MSTSVVLPTATAVVKEEKIEKEEDATTEEEEEEEDTITFDEKKAFIKLANFRSKTLRLFKAEIERIILKKIHSLDSIQDEDVCDDDKEESVLYFKKFAIDKCGNRVGLAETGIAEGWDVPKYYNEFQSLIGLPFTEDHAPQGKGGKRRGGNECFNCLSIGHGIRDCPVKQDEERMAFHRNMFNSQSGGGQVSSTRYTSDMGLTENRGMTPGKISKELRNALGLRDEQLPPYVYAFRQLGYPAGWLTEARVQKTTELTLDEGPTAAALKKKKQLKKIIKTEKRTSSEHEEGALASVDDDKDGGEKGRGKDNEKVVTENDEREEKKSEEEIIVYDEDKIYSFPGFNEPLLPNQIDESHKYGVRRYDKESSKENFLKTLTLEKKQKIIKRRSTVVEKVENEENKETNGSAESSLIDESAIESKRPNDDDNEENDEKSSFQTPCKKKQRSMINEQDTIENYGTSFTEIAGTPIAIPGAISRVPDSEKFSSDIQPHKPYEMSEGTPTGSYQKIVNLTRKLTENK